MEAGGGGERETKYSMQFPNERKGRQQTRLIASEQILEAIGCQKCWVKSPSASVVRPKNNRQRENRFFPPKSTLENQKKGAKIFLSQEK